jgi:hypothetical protein
MRSEEAPALIRITTIFAALTALLWLADRIDTPDTVPAIKPLFWGSAGLFAALLVRIAYDLLVRRPQGDARQSGE